MFLAKISFALILVHFVRGLPVVEDGLDPKDIAFMDQLYTNEIKEGLKKQFEYQQDLLDYIRSLEFELAAKQSENIGSQLPYGIEQPEPETHSVDKRRRRRYGFWITAINKMGNGGKRSIAKRGVNFIPALGSPPTMANFD